MTTNGEKRETTKNCDTGGRKILLVVVEAGEKIAVVACLRLLTTLLKWISAVRGRPVVDVARSTVVWSTSPSSYRAAGDIWSVRVIKVIKI